MGISSKELYDKILALNKKLNLKASLSHTHTNIGDMVQANYDPDSDGVFAAAQLNLTSVANIGHDHSGTYAANTDGRLSDSRTPLVHDNTLHSAGYAINTHVHAYAPAISVVNEVPWGVTPTVGIGVNYAREDHTHGTPAAPSGADPWTYLTLGAEFRTPLAAAVNVTGLSFTPAANLKYEIEGSFYVKTATATTSPRPGCAFPTGMAQGIAQVAVTASNTATILGLGHLGDNIQALGTGLPVTTNYYPASLWAMMTAGASPTGVFRVTLASETNGVNVFMGKDSFLKYRTFT